jgi:membrane protein YqaA with SNARE-associated domain
LPERHVEDRAMKVTGTGWMDWIGRFASSRVAIVLVALWSFGEAIVVAVVPDVALDLLAFAKPRRTPLLFAVSIVASILGTAVLFALAISQPASTQALVLAVPFIDQSMLDAARATVASGDPSSLALFGPGTPLKVYTVAWASGAGTPLGLLLAVVLNRLTRIGPTLLAAMGLGALIPAWLRRHDRLVVALYIAVWIVVYAGYWFGAA